MFGIFGVVTSTPKFDNLESLYISIHNKFDNTEKSEYYYMPIKAI